ncbi:hypothetical protein [Sanguibacter suaedae]|uniref:O-antigen ligase domain-containing protein n=1 Tax=Sanguibacter suaedae TaxID=2795737 RepID=A0A934I5W9_9MICO|nr:hypothetical protein [Sanguibacter suaedae]MBI9116194.1 hypothetical protein [Sanguibacter suaedae]
MSILKKRKGSFSSRDIAVAFVTGCGATLLTAAAVRSPSVVVALLAGLFLVAFAYFRPRFSVVSWLFLALMLPSWAGIGDTPLPLPPAALLGVPLLCGIALSPQRRHMCADWRPTPADWSLLAGVAGVTTLLLLGLIPTSVFTNLIFVGIAGYGIGRLSGEALYLPFAVMTCLVAAWGILEFATGVHLFESASFIRTSEWTAIQHRGSFARSEAALGHAIAYGATLAMALPFAQRLPRYAGVAQGILVVGILVSLSRGPMLAAVVTLCVAAFVSRGRSTERIRNFVLLATAGVAVVLALVELYSGESSSDEVVGSGNARARQLDTVRAYVRLSGPAGEFVQTPEGNFLVAGVVTIDSTPLRYAVNFGILIAVLLLFPVIAALVSVAARRAGPACVALVGQIPVIAVTSMITQWQTLFYLTAGMAVAEIAANRGAQSNKPTEVDVPQSKV